MHQQNRTHGVIGLNRTLIRVAPLLLAVTWIACGGGSSSSSNTKAVSNVKNRVFVTNSQAGLVQNVNVDKDQLAGTAFNISVGGAPRFMDSTPDNVNIAVFDSSFNGIAVVNSNTETMVTKVSLASFTDSMRISSDAKFVYAAVKNFSNGTGATPGAVQVVDVTNGVISANFPAATVRWLALDHAGKHVLAFPDDTSNTPYLIDLTATTPSAVPIPGTFDRPIAAYFTTDDSKAYILNCGAECGGAQAFVTELTISNLAQRSVNVGAATIGTLDGTTLYVAGQGPSNGVVSVVDTNAMTVTSSAQIGNGRHTVMRSVSGKVWVGAKDCGGAGCLSVFDTASGNVVVDNPAPGQPSKGDVTGMDFNTPSNEMFVCEGGELLRYSSAGTQVSTLVDIVGQAFDNRSVPAIQK